jgi:hypothetical protein
MSPLRQSTRADAELTTTEFFDEPTARVHAGLDTTVPTPPIALTPTPSLVSTAVESSAQLNLGITGAAKIGLGMIPVIVFMVAMFLLLLCWHRKERAARKQTQLSPSVLEKDTHSYNNSKAAHRGSSKVLHMAAFSAPVHGSQHCETRFLGQSAILQEQSNREKDDQGQVDLVAAPMKSPRTETDLDPAFDDSRPFRLKRGDTVKRYSLGPELARLWPSPPTSACTMPLATNDNLSVPIDGGESLVFLQRPGRSQR